eukprot:s574_g21.t1
MIWLVRAGRKSPTVCRELGLRTTLPLHWQWQIKPYTPKPLCSSLGPWLDLGSSPKRFEACRTPGDDGAIPQDHSKGSMRSLDLLHILQLISHETAAGLRL